MTALAVVGTIGLSVGVFGLLILSANGCNVTIGTTLLDILSMQCPLG